MKQKTACQKNPDPVFFPHPYTAVLSPSLLQQQKRHLSLSMFVRTTVENNLNFLNKATKALDPPASGVCY